MPFSELEKVLIMTAAPGALGSFVAGLTSKRTYNLRLPFSGRSVEMGYLGDIAVGVAASLGALFLAKSLFAVPLDGISKTEDFIRLMAISLIAGFAGIKLLTRVTGQIVERISTLNQRLDQVVSASQAAELVRQADLKLEKNRLEQAKALYEKALKLDPKYSPALTGLARVARKGNKLDEAIALLDRAIEANPNAEKAYYNRACYKALSDKHGKDEALADLQKAISLLPYYKQFARDDDDFASLGNEAEFQALTA